MRPFYPFFFQESKQRWMPAPSFWVPVVVILELLLVSLILRSSASRLGHDGIFAKTEGAQMELFLN